MESSKEKAKFLKTIAKQFGYEIKLTHAQEILAKLNGFKNRHALFKAEKNILQIDPNDPLSLTKLLLAHKDKFKGSDFEIPDNSLDILQRQINTKISMFYYEVHVFYSRKEGSSFFFKSDIELITEEDIIDYAIKNDIIEPEDGNAVDYTQEISQQEYECATRISKD